MKLFLLMTTLAASVVAVGCGDDTGSGSTASSSGTGGASASSAATGTTASSSADTSSSGEGAGAPSCSGGSLTHCPGTIFHCNYTTTTPPSCVEYGEADAADYEPLCTGANTWGEGCCDETGVGAQCLALGYCDGMGISFVQEGDVDATAEAGCTDFGGQWVVTP